MFNWIKSTVLDTKARFQKNSLDTVMWLVDIVPSRGGFSILKENIYVPLLVLDVVLLLYVYLVGSVVFQIKYAQGAGDFIKSYVNISLVVITLNNSYWFVMKRSLLRIVLSMVKQNDELSLESAHLHVKHAKYIAVIKKIVLILYLLNFTDAFCLYLPNQIDPTNNHYSLTPCVGLEPLTAFPQRQICQAILISQHVSMVFIVLSFQAILLFLITHTTSMYHLLSEDAMLIENAEDFHNNNIVHEKLSKIITRHALILETINNIKALYSMPLGVNFGTNAICILFFFYIPLQEWVQYSPVLIYCFLIFFLYCYLCQRLINAAEFFERAVYSCGWEYFNMKEKKLVYVMLMQAQKPILLLAADIISVNIYTFATTLQAIYKFVTVIKF